MRMTAFAFVIAGVACSAVCSTSFGAETLGTTAFSYQGRLTDGGGVANGTYDMRFRLWDSEVGGFLVGNTVTKSDVLVVGGVFTTSVDCGSQFNSSRRYLEIAISPPGAGTFEIVGDRQELLATPYASGLILPWTVNTPAASGISITAQLVPLSGTATHGFGVGVYGANTSSASGSIGVWGVSNSGIGVTGDGGAYGGKFRATNGTGVAGTGSTNSLINPGVQGVGQVGVRGDSGFGGSASYGVYGLSYDVSGTGVYGEASNGASAYAVWGRSTTGYAGFFTGRVNVNGTLTKSGGSFRIDHPLDPANKFLSHSFVESPDMMNIYNGNIVTDRNGYAKVVMPDWFEALNRDFRYQLTVIDEGDSDEFVQAKVVREMQERVFVIRTSRPGAKVSWQVTGIRQDAWANANRIPVEEVKQGLEAGRFAHPELFGMPRERAIDAKGK